jgi:hypothetical protein
MSAMRVATPRSSPTSPPLCIVLTGPLAAPKTRWLQDTIHALRADHCGGRAAVLTAENDGAVMERFATIVPSVTVRRLFIPCPCCPPAADLPRYAQELVDASRPDWLFIELPVLSAAGLLGEFDCGLCWPREIVVCLDERWSKAHQRGKLSEFQMRIVQLADRLVAPQTVPVPKNSGPAPDDCGPTAVPVLTLS